MADRIITFQYAKDNYDAYKKQTIPASNECMTKADVNTYLNADMSVLSSYTNNQLVPISKVVGMSPINLPSNLQYRFKEQGVRNGEDYDRYYFEASKPYSPIYLGEAIRTYTGGVSTTIDAYNSISTIVADIISFTSAPLSSLTMKRQPLVTPGSSEDRIYVLGNQYLSIPPRFVSNNEWKRAINPIPVSLSALDASFLVNITDFSDSDNCFRSFNLYPGGPTIINLKHFDIEILNGTEGTGYYRDFMAKVKDMPLELEFFSYGQSIGTATIHFSPAVP